MKKRQIDIETSRRIDGGAIAAASSPAGLRVCPPGRLARRRRGFNFIEVLFAVILLGLGFIMIAGIFPVALQQSTQTASETTGALVARDAMRTIQQIADYEGASALFPPVTDNYAATPYNFGTTGMASFVPFQHSVAVPAVPAPLNTILDAIGGNCYYASDHRYGWVGFYRRVTINDPYAQVVVIVLQNPNFADPSYAIANTPPNTMYNVPPPVPSEQGVGGGAPSAGPTPPPPPNYVGTALPSAVYTPLAMSPILAQLAYSTITGNSYIFLNNNNSSTVLGTADPVPNAVTGAFVLIAADPGNSGNSTVIPPIPDRPGPDDLVYPKSPGPPNTGTLTGRVLRLGAANPQLPADVTAPSVKLLGNGLNWDAFELQPGQDLKDLSEEMIAISQTTVGGPQFLPVYIIGAAPNRTTSMFDGPNQDVTVLSSFVRINTAN